MHVINIGPSLIGTHAYSKANNILSYPEINAQKNRRQIISISSILWLLWRKCISQSKEDQYSNTNLQIYWFSWSTKQPTRCFCISSLWATHAKKYIHQEATMKLAFSQFNYTFSFTNLIKRGIEEDLIFAGLNLSNTVHSSTSIAPLHLCTSSDNALNLSIADYFSNDHISFKNSLEFFITSVLRIRLRFLFYRAEKWICPVTPVLIIYMVISRTADMKFWHCWSHNFCRIFSKKIGLK